MDKRNQVGDVIKGFIFNDTEATIVEDGDWKEGYEVDVKAKGEWLVVEAKMTGGSGGMDSRYGDFYPDSWHITLQKLGSKRSYTDPRLKVRYTKIGVRPQPAGRRITVTQDTGCYSNVIPYVEPVGRFAKTVTWSERE